MQALSKVNLDIRKGEIHCLAGGNGSGKSTLIKVISGFYKADEGTIQLNGREYKKLSPMDAIEQGVQVIYQDFSVLSVVSTANFSGIVCCMVLVRAMPMDAAPGLAAVLLAAAVLAAVITGALCGLLNGFLIAKLGIPPILATLGGFDLIMGIALAFTKGSSISGLPPILSSVGTHHLFGVLPVTLIVFVLCAMVVAWRLEKTTYGYKLYMVGSNAKASRFAGVNNDRIILQTYMLSGMLASMAGVLMCARFNSARAGVGTSYTMQAILICVLGGTDPKGGFGTVRGVTIAILILQVLSSGFNMFPFLSNFYRDLIWGVVLILVMAYNHVSNLHRLKKEKKAIPAA